MSYIYVLHVSVSNQDKCIYLFKHLTYLNNFYKIIFYMLPKLSFGIIKLHNFLLLFGLRASPNSCHFSLMPSYHSILLERTDVSKMNWLHVGAFIEILRWYAARSQLRKKTTCRPIRKCVKTCEGSTFFSNIISSGKHYPSMLFQTIDSILNL